eukprot:1387114-Amphidinium_carterae.1
MADINFTNSQGKTLSYSETELSSILLAFNTTLQKCKTSAYKTPPSEILQIDKHDFNNCASKLPSITIRKLRPTIRQ